MLVRELHACTPDVSTQDCIVIVYCRACGMRRMSSVHPQQQIDCTRLGAGLERRVQAKGQVQKIMQLQRGWQTYQHRLEHNHLESAHEPERLFH